MFIKTSTQLKNGEKQTVLINPEAIATVREIKTPYAKALIELKDGRRIWTTTPFREIEKELFKEFEPFQQDLKPRSKVAEECYNPSTKSIDQVEVRDGDLPF